MLIILERVWLAIAIIGVLFTIYSLFAVNFTSYDTGWFLVISAVALAMFYLRRKQRMSMEKKANSEK